MGYLAPAYVLFVFGVFGLVSRENGFSGALAAAAFGAIAAVILFWWGAVRWAGVAAWIARILGLGAISIFAVMSVQFIIVGGPIVLAMSPLAWPGVRTDDGEVGWL